VIWYLRPFSSIVWTAPVTVELKLADLVPMGVRLIPSKANGITPILIFTFN
jgi:hypothetical protein